MSRSTIEERENLLWERCRAGDDDAREELIVASRRLVFWLAGKFRVPTSVRQDLIQEGMLALVNAVDRFEPERGFRFSTFAWHRIRGQMINMIDRVEGRAPLPVDDEFLENWATPFYDDDSETLLSVEAGIEKLPAREAEITRAIFKEGREPKELAHELGLDISHVYRLRRSAVARLKEFLLCEIIQT